jgi:starch-binding outer membrane protein, SusD/RagB family
MKKIFLIYILFISLTGCKKYLDKNPQEGGISKFSKVEQYDALLNQFRITRNRVEWSQAIMASDDCHYEAEWQTFGSAATLTSTQPWEAYSTWNQEQYKSQFGSASGFLPFQSTYNYTYDFNYIIETVDDPAISGSPLLKKQVKAEAKFWRGFYHFLLAVEHCMHPALNNGQYPGIGYRNSISPINTGVVERGTIKSTFDNIVKDIEEAAVALNEVGKSRLLTNEPWRISVPAAQAVLARVHLYLGNYTKAFDNAKNAYAAYSFLYDLNDQSRFAVVNIPSGVPPVPQTEVFNGVTYSVFPQYPLIADDQNQVSPTSNSSYWYKEAYFRFVSQLGAIQKMPPTQALYDSYNSQDLRKKVYYDNNNNINLTTWLPPRYMNQLISKSYMKNAASRTNAGYILGVTVPEIMLIMAECRARGAGDGENASIILKTLRSKRFPVGFADNIGGSLQEVKEERRRELAMLFRWHDLKRYNALDNANITVTKRGRIDPFSRNSDIVTFRLAPNAPAYALPILQSEVELLGWQQNEYSGVTKQ